MRLRGVVLAGLLGAAVVGCTTGLKRDATFVFGATQKTGEWLDPDCWKQREAKEGGAAGEQGK